MLPTKKKEQQQKQPQWTNYLLASNFGIAVGSSIAFGYNLSVVNAPYAVMSAYLNQSYQLTHSTTLDDNQLSVLWSLVVSLYLIGGFIGSFWFPTALSTAFGKRDALLLCSAIGVIGGAQIFCAPWTGSYVPLMVGRLLLGFQGGLALTIAPSLITEQAPDQLRGACGSLFAIGVPIGVLISNLFGLNFMFGTKDSWQYLFVIVTGFYIIHGTFLAFFVVESPIYLVDQKRDDDAVVAFMKLRDFSYDEVQTELAKIKETIEAQASLKTLSIATFFEHRQLWWPLIMVIHLQIVNQLTGLGAAFFYATTVMTATGIENNLAALANFGVSFATIIANAVNILFVDRLGRRLFMLAGLFGVVIGNVVLVIALSYDAFQASIVGFAVFLFCYSAGPGPLSMFMPGELFAQPAKPAAFAIGMFANWAGEILVSLVFPIMQRNMDQYCFLPFAIISFLELIFFIFYLPETSSYLVDFDPDQFAPGRSLLQLKRPFKQRANEYQGDDDSSILIL